MVGPWQIMNFGAPLSLVFEKRLYNLIPVKVYLFNKREKDMKKR
jgi:hypothetical protein